MPGKLSFNDFSNSGTDPMPHPTIRSLFFVYLLLAASGCADSDERLLELSRHSLDTQASQNSQQAAQSQAVADATREQIGRAHV